MKCPESILLPFLALKISPDAPNDGNATSFYSETATGNLVPHALFVDLGCNSIDIFLGPESGQKPGTSHVMSFETCLNLKCPSTEFGPELGSLLCPGLRQKFKMCLLTPRSPQCNHQPTQTPSQLLGCPRSHPGDISNFPKLQIASIQTREQNLHHPFFKLCPRGIC